MAHAQLIIAGIMLAVAFILLAFEMGKVRGEAIANNKLNPELVKAYTDLEKLKLRPVLIETDVNFTQREVEDNSEQRLREQVIDMSLAKIRAELLFNDRFIKITYTRLPYQMARVYHSSIKLMPNGTAN